MKKLNHITIVGPLAPPAGGMANLTLKLSQLIAKEGLSVNVIQTNRDYRPQFIKKVIGLRALFRLIPYFICLYTQTKKADVVHIMANSGWSWHLFALPAIFIAKVRHKAVVVNYHGGDAENFFSKSWSSVYKSIKRVESVVVPSPFLGRVFKHYGQDTLVIPNVVDIEVKGKRLRSFDPDNLHFIVTRNLEAIYGIDTIIKAFSVIIQKYPQARLSIAGSGGELHNLELCVKQYDLEKSVFFTGRLDASEIAKLYQSADVLINASVIDNAPSSLLEALANGIPVVSSNVGGISDMLRHEYDALLTESNDHLAFSEQIFRLIESSELRESLVDNGLETIKGFQWPIIWQKLHSCYQMSQVKNG